jgi:hypothetical protein
LQWTSLNQIRVEFSRNVVIGQTDLTLMGENIADYGRDVGFAVGGFSYDPITFTATWTLAAPIAGDRLQLTLSDSITSSTAGPLDSEWTDGVSTQSGNGQPGGALRLNFVVLPGDLDGDGQLAGRRDLVAALGSQFTAIGESGYDARIDLDANGVINVLDAALARDRIFMAPPQSPAPSALPTFSPPISTTHAAIDEAVVEWPSKRRLAIASRNNRRDAAKVSSQRIAVSTIDAAIADFPSSDRSAGRAVLRARRHQVAEWS